MEETEDHAFFSWWLKPSYNFKQQLLNTNSCIEGAAIRMAKAGNEKPNQRNGEEIRTTADTQPLLPQARPFVIPFSKSTLINTYPSS